MKSTFPIKQVSFLLLFSALMTVHRAPAEARLRTDRISSADGLSNSAVSVVFKDSSDRLWVGTWDGLNLFDGRNITVFKPEKNNPNSLPGNIILNIAEQRRDIVWVATPRGVVRFDMQTGRICRYFDGDFDQAVFRLFRLAVTSDEQVYCLLSDNELRWFDENTGIFRNLTAPDLEQWRITDIVSGGGRRLYALTDDGRLYRLDISDSGGAPAIGSCTEVAGRNIRAIRAREQGKSLWLICGDGIRILRCGTGAIENVVTATVPDELFSYSVCAEIEGLTMLASTTRGFFHYDPLTESFRHYDEPLLRCGVLCSFFDSTQNILWVGTNGNGLVSIRNDTCFFDFMPTEYLCRDNPAAQTGVVRAVCEDDRGRIWTGNRTGGVYVISEFGRVNSPVQSLKQLEEEAILAILNIGWGRMIVGSEYGNIYLCDTRTLDVRRIDMGEVRINGQPFADAVYGLYWDEDDSALWVGSNMSGVLKLKLDLSAAGRPRVAESERFSLRKGFPDNGVYSLFMLDDGRVCAATRGRGVNIIDPATGRIQVIDGDSPGQLSDNDVLYVIKSHGGTIWAGTSYGLNRLVPDGDGGYDVVQYTADSGLGNNTVHGIVEDSEGVVWVSTNGGISKIDPGSGRITNYSITQRLNGNEFADGAYCKTGGGYVVFGGNRGISFFRPEELEDRDFVPRISITGLRVNSKNVLMNDIMNKKGAIELKHNQNFFEMSFVAHDYIYNASCEYKYILEGFNPEWVNLGTANTATFTNVPAGSYNLRVMATNGDKIWSGAHLDIPVTVRKAWWTTHLAYAVYFLLIAAAATATAMYVRNRIKLRNRMWMERIERNQMQLSYEEKLRFFTNISHEFKTPLSLINIHLESIPQDENTGTLGVNLEGIRRNALRMQRLISEFLDFRKRETGRLCLSVQRRHIVGHIREVCGYFDGYARRKNVSFTFKAPDNEVPSVWLDAEQMSKVWFNLISNAFKYTPAGGSIIVEAAFADDGVRVSVSDTGVGISEGDLEHVFDNFFQVRDAGGTDEGTGVGLALTKAIVDMHGGTIGVESVPGEGSTFVVTLKYGRKHLEGRQDIEFMEADPVQPLPVQSVSFREEELAEKNLSLSEGDGAKPKLLIVEDNIELQAVLSELFSPYYVVTTASDGLCALKAVGSVLPDIIVSDVVMPEMSGYELCRRLKTDIATSHIPVVLLTAQDSEIHNIEGLECGADDYITKPFSFKLLLTRCRNILLNRKLLQDRFRFGLNVPSGIIASSSLDKELMDSIEKVMEEHLSDPSFNITRLCDELAIGRSVLFYKMKSLTGHSPMDLVRNIRLKRAAQMLVSDPVLSVGVISDRVGFSSIHYFDKCFKELFGETPTNYRNSKSTDSGSKPEAG